MATIAVSANRGASAGSSVGTTLQQLSPTPEVEWIDLVADADVYLVIDGTGVDGGAIGSLPRFRVPAGSIYPVPAGSHAIPIFIAAVTGTANVFLFGVSRE